MTPELHVLLAGETEPRRFESCVRVGRAIDNDIVLDDIVVSSRHLEIRPAPTGWELVDLGSTNGTFVGDQPVVFGGDSGGNVRLQVPRAVGGHHGHQPAGVRVRTIATPASRGVRRNAVIREASQVARSGSRRGGSMRTERIRRPLMRDTTTRRPDHSTTSPSRGTRPSRPITKPPIVTTSARS
mgnify:CR=1 FL=1